MQSGSSIDRELLDSDYQSEVFLISEDDVYCHEN